MTRNSLVSKVTGYRQCVLAPGNGRGISSAPSCSDLLWGQNTIANTYHGPFSRWVYCAKLDTQMHRVKGLRMSGALPPLSN